MRGCAITDRRQVLYNNGDGVIATSMCIMVKAGVFSIIRDNYSLSVGARTLARPLEHRDYPIPGDITTLVRQLAKTAEDGIDSAGVGLASYRCWEAWDSPSPLPLSLIII